jgi:hypothetical protein
MARAIQDVNSRKKIFSDPQKGFIQKTNGCSEHGILLNELLYEAHRNQDNLVITAVDFTNAFGSVPHELIMTTMRQRNFPSWTRNIIEDLYRGSTSVIEKRGSRSEKIPWKRGVKQGCPLSPLLFNLCLEPLLQAVTRECQDEGAPVGPAEDMIRIPIQAYADDVIFISKSPDGITKMLKVLEEFVHWSKMTVNVEKCATASYMRDRNRHRCSLAENLQFKGQPIPNLTLAQSLKYLGTAVAPRRTVKLEATEAKLTEMKIRLRKIMESPLLVVQKIDAMKTFVLPMLDFMMLNGDVGEKQLMKMDKFIRGRVDELLKVRGLPIECHHASWRDGGLSYPSLIDRKRVLMVRSFTQMMTSKDEKVKKAMRWFAESERKYRLIEEDKNAQFLNWKKMEEKEMKGTGSITARTRNTCYKMEISLKMNDEEMNIMSGELVLKTKTAVGIGRFLTQKLVRIQKAEKLTKHELHGASYTTLKNNEASNAILKDIYTRRSDAFYRFMVVGRADCLPTPANLSRWFNDRENDICTRCDKGRKQTLAHILNDCTLNYGLMTKRHNRLAEAVRKAIIQYSNDDIRTAIRANQAAPYQRLPQDLKNLRPDLMFERRDRRRRRPEVERDKANEAREAREGSEDEDHQNIIEIVEISCPYGYIAHNQDTLKKTYETKKTKYAELARTLRTQQHKEVRVTAVIVSSMGAVYGPSIKDLQKVLRCNDKEMKKLARKMSETVILGSMEIWRDNVRHVEPGNRDEVNEILRDEEARLEEARLELARERRNEQEEIREENEQEDGILTAAEAEEAREAYEDEDDDKDEDEEAERAEEEGEPGRSMRQTDQAAESRTISTMIDEMADDEGDGQDLDLQ